jgi:hypothetical protein
MGTTTDAVKNAVDRSVTQMEDLVSQVTSASASLLNLFLIYTFVV